MTPPRKKAGQARGRRSINGSLFMGIAELAAERGGTEKSIRAKVARGQLPYFKDGGRIKFLRADIERFYAAKRVLSVEQALENCGAGEET